MSKWIAEFELEDGDTMPEHMDLNYKGAKIDFHCKPLEQEPRWIPISERLPNIADVYRVTRYYPNNVMNPIILLMLVSLMALTLGITIIESITKEAT